MGHQALAEKAEALSLEGARLVINGASREELAKWVSRACVCLGHTAMVLNPLVPQPTTEVVRGNLRIWRTASGIETVSMLKPEISETS